MTAPTVQEKKPKTNPKNNKGYFKKQEPVNTQMASKLSELFKISQKNESSKIQQRHQVSTRGLAPLRQDAVDGVDHINFFANVQTELGALLSTENRLPFTYGPIDAEGKVQGETFESLKCLWAFYRTSCLVPGFRTVEDYKIRKLYSTINAFPKQESVFAVMVLGYYCKMLAYPTLGEALVECKLPFDYYIINDGVKKRSAVSKLMVNALYEVRRALMNKTLPRLESFLSVSDQEKAMNTLPVHRQGYIINILLGEDTLRKSYFDTNKNWSKADLAALNIDLGTEKHKPQTSNGDYGYSPKEDDQKINEAKREMDEAAALLNIPTAVPVSGVEIEERISLDPNCAPPAQEVLAETVTEETVIPSEDAIEEAVVQAEIAADLEVKTVSEEAVLGEVKVEPPQHHSV